ncbi:MAG: hypothetical protein V2I25_03920 [Woeseiaceae bacterium]|jgi:hypothetical protein|nr:hypothetical protein [Woeseiaceae bacterium]
MRAHGTLWLVIVVVLSGCAGAASGPSDEIGEAEPRWTYESTRDSPSGRGLLSGDDGEFTLDDLRRWRD